MIQDNNQRVDRCWPSLRVYPVLELGPAHQSRVGFPTCVGLTTAPSGKLGAEPTIIIVLILLLISDALSELEGTYTARAIRLTSACRVALLTGITWSLILKYSQAFQKAA